MRVAVVAPSCSLSREAADRLMDIARQRGDCEVAIHPQCFLSEGHFAGPDSARLGALREVIADPSVDALWFARGGYGSNRIAQDFLNDLPRAALAKPCVGYSDSGFLHAGLARAGGRPVWGPMPQDLLREGGEAAVTRVLDWLVRGDPAGLEPGLDGPAMAFNLTVLSNLLGTPLEPDLSGMDLLIEEVSEHHYRIDRMMFHLTASANVRKVARLRLGRASHIPVNDVDFGADEREIVAYWCDRAGIAYGPPADIGHDSANRLVPFGARTA